MSLGGHGAPLVDVGVGGSGYTVIEAARAGPLQSDATSRSRRSWRASASPARGRGRPDAVGLLLGGAAAVCDDLVRRRPRDRRRRARARRRRGDRRAAGACFVPAAARGSRFRTRSGTSAPLLPAREPAPRPAARPPAPLRGRGACRRQGAVSGSSPPTSSSPATREGAPARRCDHAPARASATASGGGASEATSRRRASGEAACSSAWLFRRDRMSRRSRRDPSSSSRTAPARGRPRRCATSWAGAATTSSRVAHPLTREQEGSASRRPLRRRRARSLRTATVSSPASPSALLCGRPARAVPDARASTSGSASTRSPAHAACSSGGSDGRAQSSCGRSTSSRTASDAGTALTRLYDRLDRLCCTRADARVELTEQARQGRNRRHGLAAGAAPTHIVPMGAWLDRVPTVPADGFEARRLVYLGHLVRQAGRRPPARRLRPAARREQRYTLGRHRNRPGGGAVAAASECARHRRVRPLPRLRRRPCDVARILASSSLAVAPYRPGHATFTAYADPGKLKAYLAAGLPIVLTDVPPNAAELESEAGAEVVEFDADALAAALERGLASPDDVGRAPERGARLRAALRLAGPARAADG